MRRLFILLVWLVSITANAQRDVTKFLGIPVDGSKSEMIQKLKNKGFSYNQKDDYLTGQFNDYNVEISVVTNNNKVSRIFISDKYDVNESSIKIRFNKLCKQFEKNNKYVFFDDQSIPDEEDISHEMLVNSKRYEAVFYQKPLTYDTLSIQKEIRGKLLDKYSEEDLQNPSEEIENESISLAKDIIFDIMEKSPVWFMISEKYGKYRINMFYDNEYNKSDGSDL